MAHLAWFLYNLATKKSPQGKGEDSLTFFSRKKKVSFREFSWSLPYSFILSGVLLYRQEIKGNDLTKTMPWLTDTGPLMFSKVDDACRPKGRSVLGCGSLSIEGKVLGVEF